MTNVLIAVDHSETSRIAAAVAADIFGPDARYLAINVGVCPVGTDAYVWGGVEGLPYPPVVPVNTPSSEDVAEAAAEARSEAAEVAASVGVPATPLGDVGDVCEAICRAAVEHGAHVIVTGWHQRGWLSTLFASSTADELIKSTSVPVLVVPERAGGR